MLVRDSIPVPTSGGNSFPPRSPWLHRATDSLTLAARWLSSVRLFGGSARNVDSGGIRPRFFPFHILLSAERKPNIHRTSRRSEPSPIAGSLPCLRRHCAPSKPNVTSRSRRPRVWTDANAPPVSRPAGPRSTTPSAASSPSVSTNGSRPPPAEMNRRIQTKAVCHCSQAVRRRAGDNPPMRIRRAIISATRHAPHACLGGQACHPTVCHCSQAARRRAGDNPPMRTRRAIISAMRHALHACLGGQACHPANLEQRMSLFRRNRHIHRTTGKGSPRSHGGAAMVRRSAGGPGWRRFVCSPTWRGGRWRRIRCRGASPGSVVAARPIRRCLSARPTATIACSRAPCSSRRRIGRRASGPPISPCDPAPSASSSSMEAVSTRPPPAACTCWRRRTANSFSRPARSTNATRCPPRSPAGSFAPKHPAK